MLLKLLLVLGIIAFVIFLVYVVAKWGTAMDVIDVATDDWQFPDFDD